jgi:mRNA-degrading endonuclease YafQ of YafQ-DinJ toxin-antitoxin module
MKELLEDIMNKESFEIQESLHPKFWIVEDTLHPQISKRLIEIAQDFLEGLDVEFELKDMRFTGSLASFNWSSFSDIDLHLIVDFDTIDEDTDFVRDYFGAKIFVWNNRHNITIHDFEVEIYVENEGDPHKALGLYSIMNNEWIKKPIREEADIDWQEVEKKANSLMNQIDRISQLLADKKYKEVEANGHRLKEKIRRFRRTGLDKAGVYSAENIAFKVLRRNGYLSRLAAVKTTAYDKLMSVENEGIKINMQETVKSWKNYLKGD